MNLREHIQADRGRGAELASALGIPPSFLSQIASGHRPASPRLCVQIERMTDGAVRRWDLRPHDWWQIWPELIAAEGAPAVPTETTEAA